MEAEVASSQQSRAAAGLHQARQANVTPCIQVQLAHVQRVAGKCAKGLVLGVLENTRRATDRLVLNDGDIFVQGDGCGFHHFRLHIVVAEFGSVVKNVNALVGPLVTQRQTCVGDRLVHRCPVPRLLVEIFVNGLGVPIAAGNRHIADVVVKSPSVVVEIVPTASGPIGHHHGGHPFPAAATVRFTTNPVGPDDVVVCGFINKTTRIIGSTFWRGVVAANTNPCVCPSAITSRRHIRNGSVLSRVRRLSEITDISQPIPVQILAAVVGVIDLLIVKVCAHSPRIDEGRGQRCTDGA